MCPRKASCQKGEKDEPYHFVFSLPDLTHPYDMRMHMHLSSLTEHGGRREGGGGGGRS